MMQNNKVVALVDYSWSGHRGMYLKLYTEILLELGARVIVLTEEPELMKEYVENLPDEAVQKTAVFKLDQVDAENFRFPRMRELQLLLRKWRNVANVLKQSEIKSGWQVNLVFFSYLDDMLKRIPRFTHMLFRFAFPYKYSGLLFHISDMTRDKRPRAKLMFERVDTLLKMPNCLFLTTLMENRAQVLSRNTNKAVYSFPDIASKSLPESPESLKKIKLILDKAQGRKIISLVGSISGRKGVINLMKTARLLEHEDFLFVIAGKFMPKFEEDELIYLAKFLNDKPNNILIFFELISDEEFDSIIHVSSVLYAAYRGFKSSSNMLAKSALMKTPILVSRNSLMAERVVRYNTGLAVSQIDPEQIADALRKLAIIPKSEFNLGFEKLLREHSVKAQKQKFREILNII